MQKKVQFIIPNSFIKESKTALLPRVLTTGRSAMRHLGLLKKAPRRPPPLPGAKLPPPLPGAKLPPPLPGANPTPSVVPAATPNTPRRPARGRVVEPVPQPTTPRVSSSSPAPVTAEPVTKAPAGEEGFFSKFFKDDGQRGARISRIATPAGVGVGGYFLGRGQGYDKGMGEGELMAQQLAEIQAVRMQQQARDVYQNQGLIDRVMGRNPF